ncbi:hypothetical protein GCM10008018_50180 [Paenibacillus marchantiophytorum]|uniref:XRE family transcriptional regulator n=1 Tax=Paenibacillus marchantiophytorum TaxID=1619310 RepID=A0ABQ1F2X0_9BACL|nr:hypothetical protein [Paenibacillus marchantiophytorum]GFZ97887.1 hypothetical protein GCM10008018_50180 [Paenibacillus marchantiophytorum]
MKPTLELQEIVAALGIDPFRFLAWQEKELALKQQDPTEGPHSDFISSYELVI